MCFNLVNIQGSGADYRFVEMIVSHGAGFTGGTTTTRPTATDEIVVKANNQSGGINSGYMAGNDTNSRTFRLHVMHATNGQSTRWIICTSGFAVGFGFVEKAINTVTPWVDPWACAWASENTGQHMPIYTQFNDLLWTRTRINGTNGGLYLTSEGYGSFMIGEGTLESIQNELTGEWPFFPIGLVCENAGVRGRHGQLADMYWGNTVNNGAQFPADGSRQWAQVGHIIVPWNGSLLSMT
jgi:hypothetical protein